MYKVSMEEARWETVCSRNIYTRAHASPQNLLTCYLIYQ